MSTGGSIESVSLKGRVFAVPADVDVNRNLGGWMNEVEANGNGTGRLIKTRVPFNLDGLTVDYEDGREDQEYLQDLADLTDFFDFAITFANGYTYQGTCQITGEIAAASMNSTAPISLKGPGKLTRQ